MSTARLEKGWVIKQRLTDGKGRIGATAARAHAKLFPCLLVLCICVSNMFLCNLAPCANRHFPSKRLLGSHAASTLGSLSVRKQEDMFMRQTAAFARHKHTWISLRAQRDMFRQSDSLFSRREHTWISLRAPRDMFHQKDCCDLALPPKINDFYLRTPDPVSTVKRAHVPYAIGNLWPVTRNTATAPLNYRL